MLARTPTARATRDIDLLAEEAELDLALSELKELAALDLGDYVRFEFTGSKPIKVACGRRLVNLIHLEGGANIDFYEPSSGLLGLPSVHLACGVDIVAACLRDARRPADACPRAPVEGEMPSA